MQPQQNNILHHAINFLTKTTANEGDSPGNIAHGQRMQCKKQNKKKLQSSPSVKVHDNIIRKRLIDL